MTDEKKEEVDLGDYPDLASKEIAEKLEADKQEQEKADAEKNEEEAAKVEKDKLAKEEADKKALADEEEKKKAEAEKGEEPPEEPKKIERTPKLIPAYKHETFKSQSEQREKALKAKIENLESELSNKTEVQSNDEIKKFAEDNGVEESLVAGILKLTGIPKLKKEFDEKLSKLERERSESVQDKEFEKDYEKSVIPLLEEQGVPKEKWNEAKKMLKDLAFSEDYAKTPLKVIFKGVDDFEEFIPKEKRKSIEGGRSGARGTGATDKKDVNDPELSDEEFIKLSDELGDKAEDLRRVVSEPPQ